MPQNNTKKNSCTCLSSTGLKQDIYSVLCIPDAILPFFKKEDKVTLNCQAYEIFLKKHNPDILFLMPAFRADVQGKGWQNSNKVTSTEDQTCLFLHL